MKILQIFKPYVYFGGEEGAVNKISVELGKAHDLHNVIFDMHGWAAGGGLLKRMKQFGLMAWNPASVQTVREEQTRTGVVLMAFHTSILVAADGTRSGQQPIRICRPPTEEYRLKFSTHP